jgi:hypothetical protein
MKYSSGLGDFATRLLNLNQTSPGSYGVLGVNSAQSGSLIPPSVWTAKDGVTGTSTEPGPVQGVNGNMTGRPDTMITSEMVTLWSKISSPSTYRI